MTIYDLPGTDGKWEKRMSWPSPWSELSERVYITTSFPDFRNVVQNNVIEEVSTYILKLRERASLGYSQVYKFLDAMSISTISSLDLNITLHYTMLI